MKIIFFGNGPLADFTLNKLRENAEVIFHAKRREDLDEAARLKQAVPDAFGVLASFGVLIKPDFLQIYEPEGILNLHPSLLPDLRGASPIESAILRGDRNFSYSIMKLAQAMDAGPVYHQETLQNVPLNKAAIYQALAESGANWLLCNLKNLPAPVPQDDKKATFCGKLDKSMSLLDPKSESADVLLRKIIAYQNYPKPKLTLYGKVCIIHEAHIVSDFVCEPTEVSEPLLVPCANKTFLAIDRLQPEGGRPMDARAFKNGLVNRGS